MGATDSLSVKLSALPTVTADRDLLTSDVLVVQGVFLLLILTAIAYLVLRVSPKTHLVMITKQDLVNKVFKLHVGYQ